MRYQNFRLKKYKLKPKLNYKLTSLKSCKINLFNKFLFYHINHLNLNQFHLKSYKLTKTVLSIYFTKTLYFY